tara:strand:- start:41 stop:361 length:321 start_codon:yes stop_codon:yes gene_type:complete
LQDFAKSCKILQILQNLAGFSQPVFLLFFNEISRLSPKKRLKTPETTFAGTGKLVRPLEALRAPVSSEKSRIWRNLAEILQILQNLANLAGLAAWGSMKILTYIKN